MSPTRRELLKSTAGAVGLAIAGAKLAHPVAAAKPEPLRPVSVRSVQVQIDMSDGRTATLTTLRHHGEESDLVGVLTLGYIGELETVESYPVEAKTLEILEWPNELAVMNTLKAAGIETDRRRRTRDGPHMVWAFRDNRWVFVEEEAR